ncbi:ATP-binding cassette sub-family G member 1 [Halotydeus destructor]|nr:ATP-binding cassette sub-family G member 1 [Halotydeus destructor]
MSTFKLSWDDLSYKVPQGGRFSSATSGRSVIIPPQSGSILGGQMTAIMGPSGAGKSTLVNCISGRLREGVSGSVTVVTDRDRIKIAVVPQHDVLFPKFTVKEHILFSAKMQLRTLDHQEQLVKVVQVIHSLDLVKVKDTKVNQLSGGQLKRLSIAVDLISDPQVIVLDEPTTGLDSSTAILCVNNLRAIAKKHNIAMVAVIHQPSNQVFNTFDKLYLMSSQGEQVYFGDPRNVISYFEQHGMPCPRNRSLGEHVIRAASGPSVAAFALDIEDKEAFLDANHNEPGKNAKPLKQLIKCSGQDGMREMWRIFCRTYMANSIHSPVMVFFVLVNAMLGVMFGRMFPTPPGLEDGCQVSTIDGDLTTNQLRALFTGKISSIVAASVFIYSGLMYKLCIGFAWGTVACIWDLPITQREVRNGWYSPSTYIFTKIGTGLVDMAMSTLVFYVVYHFLSLQDIELWRAVSVYLALLATHVVSWLGGILVGLAIKDAKSAVMLIIVYIAPSVLLTSFIVKPDQASKFMDVIYECNQFEHAFRTCISVLYGFGRCKSIVQSESLIETLIGRSTPRGLAKGALESYPVSDGAISRLSKLLDVSYDHLSETYNATVTHFAKLDDDKNYYDSIPSYMLEVYNIGQDGALVWINVLAIVIYLLLAVAIVYKIMRHSLLYKPIIVINLSA